MTKRRELMRKKGGSFSIWDLRLDRRPTDATRCVWYRRHKNQPEFFSRVRVLVRWRSRDAALPFSNARETCERARCESSRRPTGIHGHPRVSSACRDTASASRRAGSVASPVATARAPRVSFLRIEAAPAPVPANASLGRIPRVDAACTARRHRRADAPFAGTRVASPGRRARAARAKRVSPLSRVFADRALPLMSRPPRLLPRSLLSQSP